MRGLESQSKDQKEVVIPIPDRDGYVISERKITELFMWEVDVAKRTITKARYEKSDVNYTTKAGALKLIVKKNCIYVQALNQKSGLKKALKILGGYRK